MPLPSFATLMVFVSRSMSTLIVVIDLVALFIVRGVDHDLVKNLK